MTKYNNWKDSRFILTQVSQWHPTPVLLPGKSHGRRNPVGCSPWGRSESDRSELLHFHFSPSCIGEGNGNPLQFSCLENPRDGGAWWAAVYGVAQSQTRLKRLSSSTSCTDIPSSPVLGDADSYMVAHWLLGVRQMDCLMVLIIKSYSLSPKLLKLTSLGEKETPKNVPESLQSLLRKENMVLLRKQIDLVVKNYLLVLFPP